MRGEYPVPVVRPDADARIISFIGGPLDALFEPGVAARKESAMQNNKPAPSQPGRPDYHSTRRILGVSTAMFWSAIVVLVVAIVVILFFAL
jgi:hypothetical protein